MYNALSAEYVWRWDERRLVPNLDQGYTLRERQEDEDFDECGNLRLSDLHSKSVLGSSKLRTVS
jgi:hypothetical protein